MGIRPGSASRRCYGRAWSNGVRVRAVWSCRHPADVEPSAYRALVHAQVDLGDRHLRRDGVHRRGIVQFVVAAVLDSWQGLH